MSTVFSRTFALLNNTKAPHTSQIPSKILQETTTGSHHISVKLKKQEDKPDISIWKAAETGDVNALQFYIENSQINLQALLNMRDPDTDYTLLHLAIAHANPSVESMVKTLLEHGADASTHNVYNVQALHMVALHCPKQAVTLLQALLDAKADPSAIDGDGWTPLHYCARFCQPPGPSMNLLLSYGADINRKDVTNKTPLFALLANGDYSEDLASFLALAELNVIGDFLDPVSRKTHKGSLVLQAVKYGRIRCMNLLVSLKTIRSTVTRDELARAKKIALESNEMTLLLQELEEAMDFDEAERKGPSHKLLKKVTRIIKRSKS
ncbi:ankyrin repeat-containing domain protein [Sporodiniella umbellata]|nr:ankyrin repeat-containing domain protein [Sporodiniella umbellata]